MQLAVHEHVEPLACDLRRHTEDRDDRALGDAGRRDKGFIERTQARHRGRPILVNAWVGRNAGVGAARRLCYKADAMEITFVTTELSPFVKVGGLADVSAALPKALRALGHTVTIVVPRFPELEAQGLLLARRLTPLRFSLGRQGLRVHRLRRATGLAGRPRRDRRPGLFDRAGHLWRAR